MKQVKSRWVAFLFLLICIDIMGKDIVKLPEAKLKGRLSLEESLYLRRSQRRFKDKPLSLEMISQLLWAGQGITDKKKGILFRTAPSAGALYPIRLYLVSAQGLFRYIPEEHSLEKISFQDLREKLSSACLGQRWVKEAPINIIICAQYGPMLQRYGKRGERYVYIEVGHVAQNIHLQAVSLGLGSVPIGAFIDEEVKVIIGEKEFEPLYVIPVGYVEVE